MVNENKVSTKNAFDLKLIDHMDDIVDSFMGGRKRKRKDDGNGRRVSGAGTEKAQAQAPRESTGGDEEEHRFHEASCTIEASARIYACRVDCVHTDTYRVLGGLSSADADEEGKDGEEDGGNSKKKRRIMGVNTLERHEHNIVQQNIEADEQSDPMFRRMAAAFDAGGAKGLLLSHLPTAEDLSLIFNGDVCLKRASANVRSLYTDRETLSVSELGMGDPVAAAARIARSRLCPEVDAFRRQLWGNVSNDFTLPPHLEALLGSAASAVCDGVERPALQTTPTPAAAIQDQGQHDPPEFDMACAGPDDDGPGAEGMMAIQDAPAAAPFTGMSGPGQVPDMGPPGMGDIGGSTALPLTDVDLPPPAATPGKTFDDAIAFDELFEKFCGGGSANQFAYFDECWSRVARDKSAGIGALADGFVDGTPAPAAGGPSPGGAAPVGAGAEGTLVAATPDATRGRPPKRPLFDLSGQDRPPKPIETEPAHKHQLSEKAAQWQLHKDVPPYMIDRITMPSWPSWSKCDFACLGLRPHLMLKLVRKPQPPGDGPHSFSDLFSTVVVENPDAFPWLAMDSRMGGNAGGVDDDGVRQGGDLGEDAMDDDFDGSGLPAHLDVDPQELFLRPDDKVVPGCDGEEDMAAQADDDGGFDGGLDTSGLDFDLVDQPNKVGSTDIAYSRNSKFVDVKLVKKHLWDCISDDIASVQAANPDGQTASSFQGLIRRTVQKMPKSECENLSSQVCFICALHLCNEKNVELKTDPENLLGDFVVVGPGTAAVPDEKLADPEPKPRKVKAKEAPDGKKPQKEPKAKSRDENGLKRPMTPVFAFIQEKRAEIAAMEGVKGLGDVSKKGAELYKALPEEERARRQKRYEDEMKSYKEAVAKGEANAKSEANAKGEAKNGKQSNATAK